MTCRLVTPTGAFGDRQRIAFIPLVGDDAATGDGVRCARHQPEQRRYHDCRVEPPTSGTFPGTLWESYRSPYDIRGRGFNRGHQPHSAGPTPAGFGSPTRRVEPEKFEEPPTGSRASPPMGPPRRCRNSGERLGSRRNPIAHGEEEVAVREVFEGIETTGGQECAHLRLKQAIVANHGD